MTELNDQFAKGITPFVPVNSSKLNDEVSFDTIRALLDELQQENASSSISVGNLLARLHKAATVQQQKCALAADEISRNNGYGKVFGSNSSSSPPFPATVSSSSTPDFHFQTPLKPFVFATSPATGEDFNSNSGIGGGREERRGGHSSKAARLLLFF